jgi:predicted transcriptional regulator
LSGLDPNGAADLVNKRLRFYCEASGWNGNSECTHDDESVEPFTREAVELLHQDVTPYPRHLRRQCNKVIEEAAREEIEVIDFEFVREVLSDDAAQKLDELSELALDIVEFLNEAGGSTANAISDSVEASAYNVQESLTELEKEGLIRATDGNRGIEYKLTDQTSRELSNISQS